MIVEDRFLSSEYPQRDWVGSVGGWGEQTNEKHQYFTGAKNRNWDKLKWNWWTSLEEHKCEGMNRVNKCDSLISYSHHSGLITERSYLNSSDFVEFASINILQVLVYK